MKCAVCEAQFLPRSSGRKPRYCSPKCRNLRYRILPKRPSKSESYDRTCSICGDAFITTNPNKKTCSKSCSQERNANQARQRFRRLYVAPENWNYTCDDCGILVERSLAQGRVTKGRYGRFCKPCTKSREKARYRAKTAKRQGIVKPNNIRYEQVFARDAGICWICKESVDSSLPRTSKRGGTLDHIVPISKGGDDSLENIKLAHWICNNRKSNKLIEGLNA